MSTPHGEYPSEPYPGPEEAEPLPQEMRRLRIVQSPARPAYEPEQELDLDDAVLVVDYAAFMAAVRELQGSPLHPFRIFGQKLLDSVRHDAKELFEAHVQERIQAEAKAETWVSEMVGWRHVVETQTHDG